nr:ABC transporter ATP-binding protein [Fervidobacterium pennivorans]
MILSVENLWIEYNGIPALRGVTFSVDEEKVVSVLGPNGAGKTTLLRAISGLVKAQPGSSITFQGKDITRLPAYKIPRMGISHVPEGRQIFPELTVNENIEVAANSLPRLERLSRIAEVYEIFPELKDKVKQPGGTLSGGEQQMLAIARALVSNCKLLLVDEPSMGLAPVIVLRIFKTIREIVEKRHLTVLLVEQNARLSLPLSDYIYILSQGQIVFESKADHITNIESLKDKYFMVK